MTDPAPATTTNRSRLLSQTSPSWTNRSRLLSQTSPSKQDPTRTRIASALHSSVQSNAIPVVVAIRCRSDQPDKRRRFRGELKGGPARLSANPCCGLVCDRPASCPTAVNSLRARPARKSQRSCPPLWVLSYLRTGSYFYLPEPLLGGNPSHIGCCQRAARLL